MMIVYDYCSSPPVFIPSCMDLPASQIVFMMNILCSPLYSSTYSPQPIRIFLFSSVFTPHSCVIPQVRGRRPVLANSFASIGVDSLGAVMFIKYLSDSVGGIRIEPSKIYAPGVTIRYVTVFVLCMYCVCIGVCQCTLRRCTYWCVSLCVSVCCKCVCTGVCIDVCQCT